jgi:ATP-dependent Lon protease
MILPAPNKKDLIDIPSKIRKEMEFIFVNEIKEVFEHALIKDSEEKKAGE